MAVSAQAMEIVGDVANVTQLMSNITSSFSAVQRAVKDIKELTPELAELEYITEEGGRKWMSLSKLIRRDDEDRVQRLQMEERVRPCLEQLEKDMHAARKIAYEHRTAGSKNAGKAFINGLLGSGASEQLPATKRLKASIKCDLDILDGVINEFILEALNRMSRPQAPKSEMVVKLERLSSLNHVDPIVKSVEWAPSHSSYYQVLRGIPASVEDEDLERGSVYGGFEVENNSKLRLTMEADETRHFYFVTFDSSNSDPQLYYPQNALQNHQLKLQKNGTARRIFPSKHLYKNDPEWKLAKETTLRRDEVERCFVYILFSKSRVGLDSQAPTIMDVKRKLDAEGSWADEKEVIVECLRFDVK